MSSEIDRRAKAKGTRKTTKARGGWSEAEFIRLELSDEQKADSRSWCGDYGELFTLIQECVDDGYKFTVKRDEYNDCFAVFCQPSDSEHANGGYILTGRGGSCAGAMRECMFKHYRVLEKEWFRVQDGPGNGWADDTF